MSTRRLPAPEDPDFRYFPIIIKFMLKWTGFTKYSVSLSSVSSVIRTGSSRPSSEGCFFPGCHICSFVPVRHQTVISGSVFTNSISSHSLFFSLFSSSFSSHSLFSSVVLLWFGLLFGVPSTALPSCKRKAPRGCQGFQCSGRLIRPSSRIHLQWLPGPAHTRCSGRGDR